MSNDDLEDRLRRLRHAPPRPELRAETLDAVDDALGPARARRGFDLLLARPLPWVAAAALLAGLFAGRALLDGAHQDRVASIVGADVPREEPDPERPRTLRYAWLRRWLEGGER